MKKRTILLPLVFLVILLASLFMRKADKGGSLKEGRYALGTLCEIELVGQSDRVRHQALEAAFEKIGELDLLLSNYKPESDVSRLNKLGGQEKVEVSAVTYDLLKQSVEYARLSQGLFDITVFPLVRAWGFFQQQMKVPSPQEVSEALAKVGAEKILLAQKDGKNYAGFLTPGMEIDLGGIGKGYICDWVVSLLKERGFGNFLVNIGGNIYAAGEAPEGGKWVIGIRHPRESKGYLETVEIQNEGIATSGDYERYFEYQGNRYSHILNPKTGWPAGHSVAVTVVASDATTADAASTIIFLTPEDQVRSAFDALGISYAVITRPEAGGGLKTVELRPAPEAQKAA